MGRWALVGAVVTWAAAAAGRVWHQPLLWALVAAAGLALLKARGRAILLVICLAVGGGLSGHLSWARESAVLAAALPEGSHRLEGRLAGDPLAGEAGEWFIFQPRGWPPLLASSTTLPPGLAAGDRVEVTGTVRRAPGRAGGDPFAGRVHAREVRLLARASSPLFRIGNLIRARIGEELAVHGPSDATALVSGFLIGDVRSLEEGDIDDMRRAGLSHFVAVSGSNVALFLLGLWALAAPLALGPRRRAAIGLVGLAVFVVVTRWEASVVRAAMMAGLVLAARAFGLPLTAWTALGTAVTGLLLVSGELAGDIGFQLSVAATAGVLAGATMLGRGIARATLAATLAAQAAVAPLLLLHFGAVPLVSPLANLLAAPLVALSTMSGALGVLSGVDSLVGVATWSAGLVLGIARGVAGWPQLGPFGIGVLTLAGLLAMRPRARPAVVLAISLGLAWLLAAPGRPPAEPTAVFLDVGQGDATLLLGPGGEAVLVDGGPDPGRLVRSLRRHGVSRIQLMVLSHAHEDHAAGLVAAIEHLPVGRLWHPARHPDEGPSLQALLEAARRRMVPIEIAGPGWEAGLGAFRLHVLGPLRRYAAINDQSLVLLVESNGRSVLLPGDVEAIAQAELGVIRADVMKVPHQGSDTSDLGWLAASAPPIAVISVGPNRFGHPAPEVIETLLAAGSKVARTDQEGDVVVKLGDLALVASGGP